MPDAPSPNEVRRAPSGRTFVVLGDAGDGSSGDDMYRYREAHLTVMETSGRWAGAKFNVPTRDVASWEIA
jgi:hypothetical protein